MQSLTYHRGTETVLLVDDEESLRTVVVHFLGELGYHVLSAGDGEQAISIAKEYSGKIDLLLTDVIMGKLPGPELAQRLLQIHPAMKVVFVSGIADGSSAWDSYLRPGMATLPKPFSSMENK